MQYSTRPTNGARTALTAAAFILELVHLGWEYMHGGVAAHHLLDRADLPAISNWWGVILIPALTWFMAGRILRRISAHAVRNPYGSQVPVATLAGFAGALAYGLTLAFAHASNYDAISFVFLGAVAVSLFVPVYRAEYILGFVLGMTFTFGAILPTIVAFVIALFSRLAHMVFGTAWRMIRGHHSPHPL